MRAICNGERGSHPAITKSMTSFGSNNWLFFCIKSVSLLLAPASSHKRQDTFRQKRKLKRHRKPQMNVTKKWLWIKCKYVSDRSPRASDKARTWVGLTRPRNQHWPETPPENRDFPGRFSDLPLEGVLLTNGAQNFDKGCVILLPYATHGVIFFSSNPTGLITCYRIGPSPVTWQAPRHHLIALCFL